MSSKPHAAILCSPGLGHLIPSLELAKRLVTHRNFTVTIFAIPSPTSKTESELLKAAATPKFFDIIELPPPDISGCVGPNVAVATLLAVMMREVRPAFRSAILGMEYSLRPTVLIVDLFSTESLSIGDELGIPKYVYVASTAWLVALTVYVPVFDREVEGEYVDQTEPLRIPGCKPVQPDDVVDPMLDRTDQQYLEYVRIGTNFPKSDGILMNTWEDLEHKTIDALRDEGLLGRVAKVPIYPIGPLTRPVQSAGSTSTGLREEGLFNWLDKQPCESVIFVSLGSGGTVSFEQMTEMAWGLELSKQRFIWVVRPPAKSADAAYFTSGNQDDDPSTYLPKGFLTRTHDVGLVVHLWAPQVDILSHPSIGGFWSHSGWNSSLESITNEVPMIVWPLHAEQRMNATMLTEELGVAVRSKVLPSKKVVDREEIKEMVRKIMVDKDGQAIRGRVKELKLSAAKAWSVGGSSYNAISQISSGNQRKC
ncbi:anthocyanidin 3-O-glucosyltransferase 5 [Pyrus x bretschneideri]|uniref:anthocyanidin 3-O-glucosyltransferase 5 n=1 Tax=Pyrus x bretschneideri TaxID=225117 RepID=UPI00202EC3E0|nr:anthocyanidin 3-O-glucosyltransferase 5 [Pyrus x bretschneideri]